MNILALETSTKLCSAAILSRNKFYESSQVTGHAHAELILPMVEMLMSEADVSLVQLDALAFGRGPGSFTGVRVATAIVQGLSFGANKPVVPVSSLMTLAACAYRTYKADKILACMDARMGQVYWCAYTATGKDRLTACTSESLTAPEDMHIPDAATWFRAGPGFMAYQKIFATHIGQAVSGVDTALLPTAMDVAVLARAFLDEGRVVSAEAVLPVYLRDQIAKSKSEL